MANRISKEQEREIKDFLQYTDLTVCQIARIVGVHEDTVLARADENGVYRKGQTWADVRQRRRNRIAAKKAAAAEEARRERKGANEKRCKGCGALLTGSRCLSCAAPKSPVESKDHRDYHARQVEDSFTLKPEELRARKISALEASLVSLRKSGWKDDGERIQQIEAVLWRLKNGVVEEQTD